ncbi:MAG: TonB-dependent receptor [Bacteroidetes bacterium]|nr:TonB-dependent receptor [Fibrella sp.]
MRFIFFASLFIYTIQLRAQSITGRVLERTTGQVAPLAGATVRWSGTTVGALTDTTGYFTIPVSDLSRQLVVSYVGYQSDTLLVADTAQVVSVTLRSANTLQEVTVEATSSQIDRLNPIQTELLTTRTLAKAACCNLSESFETNASVSVQYADAVTGAKQIQFLGLGGQYVQTNVENIPTIRGLASTFGLNYIPGTWITSIDVGKGAGSVVNGYESMTGQLNIELQKPDDRNKLYLNGYANSFGRAEGNVNWSQPISKRWSVGVLGHGSTLQARTDGNNDGFLDLPLYTQINGINRWKYSSERFMAQFGVKALHENRLGGQTGFTENQRGSGQVYGFGNTTNRVEFFSKTARLYPEKPYRGLGLILNAVKHDQNSYFGFAPYNGRQQMLYGNLIYQSIIGTTNHTYKAGLSYLLDDYNERYKDTLLTRTESVPGVFAEYTYNYPDKLTLVLGGRFDYHNLSGTQFTPRLHIKYNLSDNLALRASAGRGFRVANPLAENYGLLVSSRTVVFRETLRPEVSWNYGLSLTNDFLLAGKKATLILDYYRTDLQNQLIVDLEHTRLLQFYNSNGAKSFANSLQAELNYVPVKRLDVKLAYRFFDVRQTMGGASGESALLPRMMISRDRVLVNAGYALPFDKWKFDATLQWNGPRRIPYLREGYSHTIGYANMLTEEGPGFYNLNAQVTRTFRNGIAVYLGGENLTVFRQLTPVFAASNPFGPDFDAGSRVWGPVTGRMVYVGIRFKPNL